MSVRGRRLSSPSPPTRRAGGPGSDGCDSVGETREGWACRGTWVVTTGETSRVRTLCDAIVTIFYLTPCKAKVSRPNSSTPTSLGRRDLFDQDRSGRTVLLLTYHLCRSAPFNNGRLLPVIGTALVGPPFRSHSHVARRELTNSDQRRVILGPLPEWIFGSVTSVPSVTGPECNRRNWFKS